MKINACVISDKGIVREKNEDNFYFDGQINESVIERTKLSLENANITKNTCFVIADGMGGYNYGEKASYTMVDKVKGALDNADSRDYQDMIEYAVGKANDEIIEIQQKVGKCGTTCTAVLLDKKGFQTFYVGDSRVYLIRDNKITRVTHDHTIAALRINLGVYKENDAEEIYDRSLLTNYVGMNSYRVDIEKTKKQSLKKNDYMLICSDGLYDMCSDEEILNIINDSTIDIEKKSDELLELSLNNGGEDNVTLIIINVL